MKTDIFIHWRTHFTSPPARVYEMFTTDAGRARFWAETSEAKDNHFVLSFLGEDETVTCETIESHPPDRFTFHYWDGTKVMVRFTDDGKGGTDLILTETGFPSREHREENFAGWVTVLMNLKAVVDHGVDLRNHDPERTWKHGYCET
jgi:uncharacterized protein YndB with AHSA1/START domain